MKREWKEIPRGDIAPQAAGFRATMNTQGVIAFSRATFERMGSPEAVHLLYDPANNTIGLKPTVSAMRNAYPLTAKDKRGRRLLRALRLLREANLVVPQTVEFQNIEIDLDGILVLDLRSTRVSARYLNNFRRKQLKGRLAESRTADPHTQMV